MGLKDGINKVVQDQQKLQNQAASQAISPLTERVANNNTNPHSTKMSGTQAAQQGAANQIAKDQTAVQNGALAQQQQGAAQQRDLQASGTSVADFRSQGVEMAQEAVNQKAQEWSKQMARFGSLGQRVSTAVQEEMAAGGQVAQEFEVNQKMMDEAVQTLGVPGKEAEVGQTVQGILDSVQAGDPQAAMQLLMNNAQIFNVDTTNSGAALTQIFEALNLDPSSQQAMVTNALADGVIDPDNLTMDFMLNQGVLTTDNAMIPELGLTVAEIEEAVGPDWREMTAGQIADAVELSFDDAAERDDIMRELSNPNIDPARKAELMRELQLLDASGVTSAEERAARGVDRVQQADQVLMGGKLQSVEDVLSDENIRAKSDDLLMQLQADPENAAAILEKWKKDNPGYETMGDWINEQQAVLNNKGEAVKSATELIEQKNKEASEFVNNNELFGADDGAKNILTELGFDVEGFGAMGNDPSTNPAYQALLNAKNTDPEKFELFKSNLLNMEKEDLEGLKEVLSQQATETDPSGMESLLQVLGTREGMEDFNYLRNLNNELAITDTSDYVGVMSAIFPDNHPLKNLATSPETAQKWLTDLKKMKDLGFGGAEYDALSAILDGDGTKDKDGNIIGDGKVDDPETIAKRIKDIMGEGFNLGNFQGDAAKQLLDLINNTEKDFGTFIKETATEQYKKAADNEKNMVDYFTNNANSIKRKKTKYNDTLAEIPGLTYQMQLAFRDGKFPSNAQKLLPEIAKAAGIPDWNAYRESKIGKRPKDFSKVSAYQKQSLALLQTVPDLIKAYVDKKYVEDNMKHYQAQTKTWKDLM